ncbi:MAG: hypothetical protein WBA12_14845 [Catalinimonas sp.]
MVKRRFSPLFLLCTLLCAHVASAQTRYFVAAGRTAWLSAFTELQDALDLATAGDTVLVAVGTYTPTVDEFGNAAPADPRTRTFLIPDGVVVIGGLNGTETNIDLTARDLIFNLTVLSGDLDILNDETDNAYHVVTTRNASSATVVDGFTVRGGNADGDDEQALGGGWYDDGTAGGNSRPTLRNTIFMDNFAVTGGGMYAAGERGGDSSPKLVYCEFKANLALVGGAGFCASGNEDGFSAPRLVNCGFVDNFADIEGGAAAHYGEAGTVRPTYFGTLFYANSADFGGGMLNYGYLGQCTSYLVNCTFTDNQATFDGAGVYNDADLSGAVSCYVRNGLFWNNVVGTTEIAWANAGSTVQATARHVLLSDPTLPPGTIDAGGNLPAEPDPFVDYANADFRLALSGAAVDAGRDTTDTQDLDDDGDFSELLFGGSTVVFDLDSARRFQGTAPDLGAYEGGVDPLPVSWLSFGAARENGGVVLTWQTALEINNAHFEVERSIDAVAFERIGAVTGGGNRVGVSAYDFRDRRAPAGVAYYRLRQVDFDGGWEYSAVVMVSPSPLLSAAVRVVPNPCAAGRVRIEGVSGEESLRLTLLDPTGRTVSEAWHAGSSRTAEVALTVPAGLAAGGYAVRVTAPTYTVTRRVVIVR